MEDSVEGLVERSTVMAYDLNPLCRSRGSYLSIHLPIHSLTCHSLTCESTARVFVSH